jgi:hypothetical protein
VGVLHLQHWLHGHRRCCCSADEVEAALAVGEASTAEQVGNDTARRSRLARRFHQVFVAEPSMVVGGDRENGRGKGDKDLTCGPSMHSQLAMSACIAGLRPV